MIEREETAIISTQKFFEFAIMPIKTEADAIEVEMKVKAMSIDEMEDLHQRLHIAIENLDLFHAALVATINLKATQMKLN